MVNSRLNPYFRVNEEKVSTFCTVERWELCPDDVQRFDFVLDRFPVGAAGHVCYAEHGCAVEHCKDDE